MRGAAVVAAACIAIVHAPYIERFVGVITAARVGAGLITYTIFSRAEMAQGR